MSPLLLLTLLSAFHISLGQNFGVMLLGGTDGSRDAVVFNVLSEQKAMELPKLPENSDFGPLVGFMDNNITVCGGTMSYCYYLQQLSEDNFSWEETMRLGRKKDSTMIATYDFSNWTIFGAQDYWHKSYSWSSGMDSFSENSLDFYVEVGACSTRVNQTHAIVAYGKKDVFWFREDNQLIKKWESGAEKGLFKPSCGMAFNSESGHKFIMAGGSDPGDGIIPLKTTHIFDFNTHSWTVYNELPRPIGLGASVQFQNTFLLLGGYNQLGDQNLDEILRFDEEEGWMEMSAKLPLPNHDMGALHVALDQLKVLPN